MITSQCCLGRVLIKTRSVAVTLTNVRFPDVGKQHSVIAAARNVGSLAGFNPV
jgi:hypothetical protein